MPELRVNKIGEIRSFNLLIKKQEKLVIRAILCINFRDVNQGQNLVATSAMVGRIFSLLDKVKVSENLGATEVTPVAPVDMYVCMFSAVDL